MIDTTTLSQDIDREYARRCYYAVSFRPEKRGDMVVDSYVETMQELAEYITEQAKEDWQKEIADQVFQDLRAGYLKKTMAELAAQSRCMSSMITGPANFPVRRAEKANEAQRKRSDEWLHYHKNLKKYADKKLAPVLTNQEKQLSELEQMKKKLQKAEENHQLMKDCNALIRKKDHEGLKKRAGEKLAAELLKPNYMGACGFEGFMITNNLANIKRMRGRVAELERKAEAAETKRFEEQEMNGLTVVKNYEEDRLQLLFQDKPEASVRSALKSHGFRWAPSQGAWQRKLTNNALYSFEKHLMQQEAMKQYA